MSASNAPMILVVDGDRDTRSALEELLLGDGFGARGVSGVDAALAELDGGLFHLVIADAEPSLQGVRRLRDEAHPIPVGILTGWPLQEGLAEFAFTLSKPFDIGSLLAAMAGALGSEQVAPPAEAAVRAYFDALDRRDWNQLAGLCAEDVEYALPGSSPYSATVRGREQFLALTKESFAAFPVSKFERLTIYPTPAGACARYFSRWAHESGRTEAQSGAVSFEVDGEKIRRIRVRLNLERLPAKRA